MDQLAHICEDSRIVIKGKGTVRCLRSFMGNTKAGKCDEFINHRYLLLLCLSFFQILQKAFFKQAPAGNLFKDHREDYSDAPAGNLFKDHREDYSDAPAGNFFKDHRRDYSKGVPAASASRAFCKTVSNAIAALLYSSSLSMLESMGAPSAVRVKEYR